MSHMPDGQSYSVTSMPGQGISKINQVLQSVPELVKYKKVFESWDDKKSNTELKSEFQKAFSKTTDPEMQNYQPELQKELDKTRDQIVYEVEAKENNPENDRKKDIGTKDEELMYAHRVMGIQNAILLKLYEQNPSGFVNTLRSAKLTEDDIELLKNASKEP